MTAPIPAETLAYGEHRVWLHRYLAAASARARLPLIAMLPRRLSGGWRAVLADAVADASARGQRDVARRIARRLDVADAPADDGTSQHVYTCSDCGHVGPLSHYGQRRMDRAVSADPTTGEPALLPHWTVDSVTPTGDSGRFAVRIVVRQNACRACRARVLPDDRDAWWAERDARDADD